jgi:hypothetical protein
MRARRSDARSRIVAIIAVGGFVCMVEKIEGGQTIVVSVIGLVTGWIGAKASAGSIKK